MEKEEGEEKENTEDTGEEEEDDWPETNGKCDDNRLKDVELPTKEQQNTNSHHWRNNI